MESSRDAAGMVCLGTLLVLVLALREGCPKGLISRESYVALPPIAHAVKLHSGSVHLTLTDRTDSQSPQQHLLLTSYIPSIESSKYKKLKKKAICGPISTPLQYPSICRVKSDTCQNAHCQKRPFSKPPLVSIDLTDCTSRTPPTCTVWLVCDVQDTTLWPAKSETFEGQVVACV